MGGDERVGNTFITETKGEKPMTGVMPLEGSDEHPTQEATEIKVMNSNEQAEKSSIVQEGNDVENVFNSKIGPSTANPEISQIYGMDPTTAQTSYFDSKMVSRQQ